MFPQTLSWGNILFRGLYLYVENTNTWNELGICLIVYEIKGLNKYVHSKFVIGERESIREFYEVPPKYIGQRIEIRFDDDDVFIYEDGLR